MVPFLPLDYQEIQCFVYAWGMDDPLSLYQSQPHVAPVLFPTDYESVFSICHWIILCNSKLQLLSVHHGLETFIFFKTFSLLGTTIPVVHISIF